MKTSFLPLAMVAAVAGLLACSRPEALPEPVRAVRTMTVATAAVGGSPEFAAEIRARTEARLGFRVAGKLIRRQAEVGQRVKAGQTLAQLDPTDLKLAQAAALAALQAAQSTHELAQAEFKSYKDLRDRGFISSLELERRETGLRAQKAQLDQARANAAVQGNLAAYAQLAAPASGVVTGVDAEVGAVLPTGATVVRLAFDGARDVVFAVPEDGVAAVRALQGKPGAIRVRAWGGSTTVPASVREVAAAADPATRTFLVKADVGAAPVQLGQTVTAMIDKPGHETAITLPLSALMSQHGQSSVWLLDTTSMTVKVQPVVVAGADGNDVVLASGLSPGQTVVTAGVHTLTEGQKVKLYQAQTTATLPLAARPGSAVAATPATPR